MTPRQLLRGLILLCLLAPGLSAAEPGLSADEIRIGMVNAQSGPAAALGLGMLNGAQAYFKRVNAEGGVHGRRIACSAWTMAMNPAGLPHIPAAC